MTDDDRPDPRDLGITDTQAEQGVLGAMLINPDVIADMSALLRASDFYRPVHGTLFDLMVDMYGRGLPVDQITVVSALLEAGELDRVGGAPYVHTLVEWAAPAAVRTYALAVADRATERAIDTLGVQAQHIAKQPGSAAAKVAMIRDAADGLAAHREVASHVWVGDALDAALADIERLQRGETGMVIPTPWRDLNRMLGGGFRPGQFIVVAARPGLGKSTVLLDVLRHAARRGITSGMVSLEMPEAEIMQRFLSAETGVPLTMIRTGAVRDDEADRITSRVPDLIARPLAIVDAPGATLSFTRAEGRRLAQREGLRLWGVDYLQLMPNPKGAESRQQGVSEISRGLKLLSREADLSVIAAAQLNRNPEQRRDKRPGLADLRESGSIEQDADIVILLSDPSGGDPTHPRAGEYDFDVAKHRGGPTGVVTVTSRLHLAHFADMRIV